MDSPFESPIVLSFCPGILGIERGLARAGINCRVAAYVEIEAFIIANLVAGMESGVLDPAPIWTDVKTFDASPFRGKIHGIIGGYPCPGESLAGLREGHLYKGFIWPAIRKAIAAARPLWCFFENVDDHLTGTYPIVQRSLRNMGYAVEAGIFTAEEAGSPQERKRLFILAIMANCKSERNWGLPEYQQGQEWNIKNQNTNTFGSGKELAHTTCSRQPKFRNNGQPNEKENTGISSAGADIFPAGQGYFQYPWEAKRAIEPRLVYSAHGYNFREDILRAIGNSVVEQTAELAFITLLEKFKN